jgi:hypothetical protein
MGTLFFVEHVMLMTRLLSRLFLVPRILLEYSMCCCSFIFFEYFFTHPVPSLYKPRISHPAANYTAQKKWKLVKSKTKVIKLIYVMFSVYLGQLKVGAASAKHMHVFTFIHY